MSSNLTPIESQQLLHVVALNNSILLDQIARAYAKNKKLELSDLLNIAEKTSEITTMSLSEYCFNPTENDETFQKGLFRAFTKVMERITVEKILSKTLGINLDNDKIMSDHDCDTCAKKGNCPVEDHVRVRKLSHPNLSFNREEMKNDTYQNILKLIKQYENENQFY